MNVLQLVLVARYVQGQTCAHHVHLDISSGLALGMFLCAMIVCQVTIVGQASARAYHVLLEVLLILKVHMVVLQSVHLVL